MSLQQVFDSMTPVKQGSQFICSEIISKVATFGRKLVLAKTRAQGKVDDYSNAI
jgi:hypothetical protein